MKPSIRTATAVLAAVSLGLVMSGTLVSLEVVRFRSLTQDQQASPVPKALLNSAVTQQTIQSTICTSGYTKSIRPNSSYTSKLKIQQINTLHLTPTDPSQYEEDHWIPLELGGNPTDPRNLWPQLWPDARNKDKLETSLKRQVCSNQITLAYARQQMYTWKK